MGVTNLTQQRLKELLHYDAATGIFTWLVSPSKCTRAGAVAGYKNGDGYVQIQISGRTHYAHRLAWLYMTGVWPTCEIDHRHGVAGGNRWENLREAPGSLNDQNRRRANRNNRSGLLGVSPAGKGRFTAKIELDGKRRRLGYFRDARSAHAAYLVAKRKTHPGCTI